MRVAKRSGSGISRLHDRVFAPELAWLIAALLFSLALRVPFFKVAMIADEGGYAYATRGWLDGTGQLYGDLWISRPQGIFFVYAAIFKTLGTGTVAFRVAAWIACALTTLVVWAIARRWLSPRGAIYAAFCFGFFSSLPNIEGFTANAEIFMGFPSAMCAWLLLHAHGRNWPRWSLIAIGMLCGIATQLKPSGLVMLLVAFAFLLLIEPQPLHLYLRRCGWMLIGLAIIGIPSLVHGYFLGWHDFFYATISYRLTSQSSATVPLIHHLTRIADLGFRCYGLTAALLIMLILRYRRPLQQGYLHACGWLRTRQWFSRSPMVLHAVAGPGTIRSLSRPTDEVGFLIRLWSAGCLLGIGIGGDWWAHYLIQIAAPFSIWFARTSVLLWRDLWKWDRPIYATVISLLLLTPYWVLFAGNHDARSITDALFGHAGYPAQDEIARYLRDHTEPGDTIYVAFDQAAIYYLADRKPAYKHLYDQELLALPDSYSDILSIIQGPNRPKYIVTTRQTGPFPDDGRAFWQVVSNYYDFETDINGVPLLREKEDPPPPPG
jgi:hypothetical protein